MNKFLLPVVLVAIFFIVALIDIWTDCFGLQVVSSVAMIAIFSNLYPLYFMIREDK